MKQINQKKQMKPVTITIDGPAGSGKGTTAMKLAEKLNFKYLDTGSMWRALGLYISTRCTDIAAIKKEELEGIKITFNEENHVCLNGEDYESKIRNTQVSVFGSQLASQKFPRELVISIGQEIIARDNYVLEGRDTGTIWSPDAQVKLYLTADAAVRAHRRWLELEAKGEQVTESEVLKQIIERDERDMTRSDGPLVKPQGAHEIDTTHMSIDEQVEKIYEIVQNQLGIMN